MDWQLPPFGLGSFELQQQSTCLQVFSGNATPCFKCIVSLGQPDLEIVLVWGQLPLPLEKYLGISTVMQTYLTQPDETQTTQTQMPCIRRLLPWRGLWEIWRFHSHTACGEGIKQQNHDTHLALKTQTDMRPPLWNTFLIKYGAN